MGLIKTKGIILSESNMGDFDKMLTMLTPDLRQNLMFCKRSEKTKQFNACWNPIFGFQRVCFIQRKQRNIQHKLMRSNRNLLQLTYRLRQTPICIIHSKNRRRHNKRKRRIIQHLKTTTKHNLHNFRNRMQYGISNSSVQDQIAFINPDLFQMLQTVQTAEKKKI